MLQFDIDPYLKIAEQLVEHDETEMAIKVLEMLPAYYRQNVPEPVHKLKNEIIQQTYTAYDYANNMEDEIKHDDFCVGFIMGTFRGKMISEMVRKYNHEGKTPHIVDFGPGDFCLPIGLQCTEHKFTYRSIGLQSGAAVDAKEKLNGIWKKVDPFEPTIYVACEVIEHLPNVDEIRTHFNRITSNVEKIILSTPKFTYGDGNPTWRSRKCPHLRAYTPQEFINQTIRLFPEYKLTYHDDIIQTITGEKQ